MGQLWITIGLEDRSTFYMMMANASATFSQKKACGHTESEEATMYYTKSIQAVRNNMQNPVRRFSDEVIAGILGFACHDVSLTPLCY
jgi:hypothetical protein